MFDGSGTYGSSSEDFWKDAKIFIFWPLMGAPNGPAPSEVED